MENNNTIANLSEFTNGVTKGESKVENSLWEQLKSVIYTYVVALYKEYRAHYVNIVHCIKEMVQAGEL